MITFLITIGVALILIGINQYIIIIVESINDKIEPNTMAAFVYMYCGVLILTLILIHYVEIWWHLIFSLPFG